MNEYYVMMEDSEGTNSIVEDFWDDVIFFNNLDDARLIAKEAAKKADVIVARILDADTDKVVEYFL
jgi:hypothetical protein